MRGNVSLNHGIGDPRTGYITGAYSAGIPAYGYDILNGFGSLTSPAILESSVLYSLYSSDLGNFKGLFWVVQVAGNVAADYWETFTWNGHTLNSSSYNEYAFNSTLATYWIFYSQPEHFSTGTREPFKFTRAGI